MNSKDIQEALDLLKEQIQVQYFRHEDAFFVTMNSSECDEGGWLYHGNNDWPIRVAEYLVRIGEINLERLKEE